MRVYVCGPMSGLPDHNFDLFKRVTAHLREIGYDVVCPTEISHPDENKSWETCLQLDLVQMLACDSICPLRNWTSSKGALLEMLIAFILGYKFIEPPHQADTTINLFFIKPSVILVNFIAEFRYKFIF